MIINNKKLVVGIFILYPIINLMACIIFKGNNMNTISGAFCIAILCLDRVFEYKINKKKIVLLFLLSVPVVISFIRESTFSNKVIALLFATAVLMFSHIGDGSRYLADFKNIIISKSKVIYISQSVYIFALLMYVEKNGMQYGWNTIVLQGPYNYPHTLAYMLLFMLCLNIFIILNRINVFAMLLAALEIILILLTAVRSVYVSLAILILFVCWIYTKKKQFSKLLFLVVLGSIAVLVAWNKGVFDAFITKTMLSVQGGYGLTNNRVNTFVSSLSTFQVNAYYPFNIVFGVGLDVLCENNFRVLGEPIHAHNDLIDALVSYGAISLLLYVRYLYKMSKVNRNKGVWILCFLGVLIIFNGLFTYVDVTPILFYPILLFNYTKRKEFE